jgi:glycosyltransferase involved in cell wall biosynthesis
MSPSDAREQLSHMGVDPSVLTVTWAGKFRLLKRPLDMIQAFCKVNTVFPLQLLMVGSGELASEIRNAVPEQLKHRCVLPGFVNQSLMPVVFSAGEIYTMTSVQEPLGMSVVEAMATGAACIVSDACGIVGNDELLDTLIPGVTGLAFSAGDVNDLASKLSLLALDPHLRRRISEAGRARALARTARTTANSVIELVLELAENQKPS